MIISFLQEKGGAGKTTISINVAYALKKIFNRKVILIDSDPQGSARDWHENNNGEKLEIIGIDRPTIEKDLIKFKEKYDFIIIDGAPHLSLMVTKTIVCSDIIFIPVQPSPYDVWASAALVDLIKQRQDIICGKLKAAFIISRKINNTIIGEEVRTILKDYGLPILNFGTSQKIIYSTSAAKGETVLDDRGLAQNEIINLTKEILEFIYV